MFFKTLLNLGDSIDDKYKVRILILFIFFNTINSVNANPSFNCLESVAQKFDREFQILREKHGNTSPLRTKKPYITNADIFFELVCQQCQNSLSNSKSFLSCLKVEARKPTDSHVNPEQSEIIQYLQSQAHIRYKITKKYPELRDQMPGPEGYRQCIRDELVGRREFITYLRIATGAVRKCKNELGCGREYEVSTKSSEKKTIKIDCPISEMVGLGPRNLYRNQRLAIVLERFYNNALDELNPQGSDSSMDAGKKERKRRKAKKSPITLSPKTISLKYGVKKGCVNLRKEQTEEQLKKCQDKKANPLLNSKIHDIARESSEGDEFASKSIYSSGIFSCQNFNISELSKCYRSLDLEGLFGRAMVLTTEVSLKYSIQAQLLACDPNARGEENGQLNTMDTALVRYFIDKVWSSFETSFFSNTNNWSTLRSSCHSRSSFNSFLDAKVFTAQFESGHSSQNLNKCLGNLYGQDKNYLSSFKTKAFDFYCNKEARGKLSKKALGGACDDGGKAATELSKATGKEKRAYAIQSKAQHLKALCESKEKIKKLIDAKKKSLTTYDKIEERKKLCSNPIPPSFLSGVLNLGLYKTLTGDVTQAQSDRLSPGYINSCPGGRVAKDPFGVYFCRVCFEDVDESLYGKLEQQTANKRLYDDIKNLEGVLKFVNNKYPESTKTVNNQPICKEMLEAKSKKKLRDIYNTGIGNVVTKKLQFLSNNICNNDQIADLARRLILENPDIFNDFVNHTLPKTTDENGITNCSEEQCKSIEAKRRAMGILACSARECAFEKKIQDMSMTGAKTAGLLLTSLLAIPATGGASTALLAASMAGGASLAKGEVDKAFKEWQYQEGIYNACFGDYLKLKEAKQEAELALIMEIAAGVLDAGAGALLGGGAEIIEILDSIKDLSKSRVFKALSKVHLQEQAIKLKALRKELVDEGLDFTDEELISFSKLMSPEEIRAMAKKKCK